METQILNELDSLVTHIRGLTGLPYYPKKAFTVTVGNVICAITFGKRYPIEGCTTLKILIEKIDTAFGESGNLLPVFLLPVLEYLPHFKRSRDNFLGSLGDVNDILRQFIAEHEESHEVGDESDFIHAFMNRMGDEYDSEDMLFLIRDFILAGTETTATTLQWAVIYMANNPSIQVRCFVKLYTAFIDFDSEKELIMVCRDCEMLKQNVNSPSLRALFHTLPPSIRSALYH